MSDRFRPKPLPSVSVDAPMERHWDVMGADEARRLHARAQDEVRRFSWTGPRAKRRLLRCFVLTPLGFAAIGFLFVAGNATMALAFLGAGLALGALTFVLSPVDFLSGAVYAACGFLGATWGGSHVVLAALAALLCGSIGIAQGRLNELRRIDGDD